MITLRRLIAAAALAAAAGCASRAFVHPSGPGIPAPDAADVWENVSSACRGLSGVQAALGLTGRIGDQRIPGLAGATLYAAVSSAGAIGLEARVSSQLAFRMGGTAERATLFLPADNRVVVAPAADIVDALVGVRVTPERLLALLGGCMTRSDVVTRAARHAALLEVGTADATVFLEQRGGSWGVRAAAADGLVMEYRRSGNQIRDIVLDSAPGSASDVSLVLRLKQFDLAPNLAPAMFTVAVPDDARPMTVEELRASGLDGERERSR
jgi:hypothetical protein